MKIGIHEKRFRGAIRLHTQKAIAHAMGISQPAMAEKLRNLEIMRFSDFNRICKIMGEDPREFITIEKNAQMQMQDTTIDWLDTEYMEQARIELMIRSLLIQCDLPLPRSQVQ